jgi:hypothetical protein
MLRVSRALAVLLAALTAAVAAGQAASSASRTTASFYSPSRNLGCELDDRRAGVPNEVFCQSLKAPHSVKLGLNGQIRVCRGETCLGNPGEGTPVLAYGRQITVGRFRCFSLMTGVKCIVIRSGKGFLIDKAGVRRLG